MIPNLSPSGRSFKGAFAYHMHDKDRADSSDRVDWTSARNVMADDPRTVERIMIATAKDADRLKASAGVKVTGRKSTSGPVQTLSLAWHPDERVSRAEMEKAADSVLRELGLEEHQAYIVAHKDRAHQHVHLIVNRVNPNDGRTATLSNSKRILDQWAHRYEQERGHIVSPNRAEKYSRQEKAREKYSSEERRSYVIRKRKEQADKRQLRRVSIETSGVKSEAEAVKIASDLGQKVSRAEALRDLSAVQFERHKTERKELSRSHWQAEKEEAFRWSLRVKEAHSAHKDEPRSKLEWKDLAREHGKADRLRLRLEKTARGRLALSIEAAKAQQKMLRQDGKRSPSLARLTWANVVNPALRKQTSDLVKARDKSALREKHLARLQPAIRRLEELRDNALSQMRSEHQRQRESLRTHHDYERDKMREAWRELPWVERQKVWEKRKVAEQKQQTSIKRPQENVRSTKEIKDTISREQDKNAQALKADKERAADANVAAENQKREAEKRQSREAAKSPQSAPEVQQKSPLEQMRENRDKQGERNDGRSPLERMRESRDARSGERVQPPPEQKHGRDDRDR